MTDTWEGILERAVTTVRAVRHGNQRHTTIQPPRSVIELAQRSRNERAWLSMPLNALAEFEPLRRLLQESGAYLNPPSTVRVKPQPAIDDNGVYHILWCAQDRHGRKPREDQP